MQGTWIKIGATERPYAEIASDTSGLVYVSVQSGAARTSDYLTAAEAKRFGRELIAAAERADHQHEWKPLGFTPHPGSGGLMPTDGCACGARRYPYSPEVG